MSEPNLWIISLPIGNKEDISSHAIKRIVEADIIIGEEHRETARLLARLDNRREFELLNEHSTKEEILELVNKVEGSKSACLISDVGTPTLEDPGAELIQLGIERNWKIKMVPGPSALITGLVLSGFSSSPFTFWGFLDREESNRKKEIQQIKKISHTVVLYETPYRYKKVIEELSREFSGNLRIFLGLDLTSESEIQVRGNLSNVLRRLENLPKAPPVIVLDLGGLR